MKCKKAERKIIEGIDELKSLKENDELMKHLESCAACRGFFESTLQIINIGGELNEDRVPEKIKAETLEKSLTELHRIAESGSAGVELRKPIPLFIRILLFVITGLTVVWILSVVGLEFLDVLSSWQLTWAGVVVFQNFITLLLAPVLLSKYKKRKSAYNHIGA